MKQLPPAEYWSFVPAHPDATDFVRLRKGEGSMCEDRYPYITVDLASHTIAVAVSGSDVACSPDDPTYTTGPLLFDVGYLPPGIYTAEFEICIPRPPPEPPCGIFYSTQLAVAAPHATTIPTLTATSLAIAALLLAATALLATRRR